MRVFGVTWIVVSLALLALVGLPGGAVAGSADASPVRVLVVKVTWGPQPFTDSDVDAAMQTATQFYTTASFGKVALTYSQTRWITSLSGPPACRNASDVATLIPQLTALAADAGYSVSADERAIFLLPSASCGFIGITQSGGIVLDGTLEAGVVIHELGHTFGMGHASALACRYTPSNQRFCTSDPSGDLWDVMGSSLDFAPSRPAVGDFGALQKARAGWLTSYLRMTKPGLYRLANLEQASTLPQALVIHAGAFEYWVDHREPVGNDAYLAGDPRRDVTSGFEVHRITGDPLTIAPTKLTPDYLVPRGKPNFYYTPPGATFTEPHLFSLTATGRSAGTMTIRFRWLHH